MTTHDEADHDPSDERADGDISHAERAIDAPDPGDPAASADVNVCPVCGYDGLAEPPYNEDGGGSFEICPCCGFEYGYDDHSEGVSHAEHREAWLAGGAQWFDPEQRPDDWDRGAQLARIGL